jgi:hypothetical protein
MTGQERLIEQIEAKRWDANHFIEHETPVASGLAWSSIVLAGLTALFSTVSAAGGMSVFDAVGLSMSWRTALVVTAALSALSTGVGAALKTRQSEAHIGKAQAAVAKLDGLVVRLDAGATAFEAAASEFDAMAQEIPFGRDIKPLDVGKFELDGRITSPKHGEHVGRTIECSGYARPHGLAKNLHYWLMVEVMDGDGGTTVWPKERALCCKKPDGAWQRDIYEDGRSPSLDVGLYVASKDANEKIKDWVNRGANGAFRPVQGFPSCHRLHRVEGLVVEPSKKTAVIPPP